MGVEKACALRRLFPSTAYFLFSISYFLVLLVIYCKQCKVPKTGAHFLVKQKI